MATNSYMVKLIGVPLKSTVRNM